MCGRPVPQQLIPRYTVTVRGRGRGGQVPEEVPRPEEAARGAGLFITDYSNECDDWGGGERERERSMSSVNS